MKLNFIIDKQNLKRTDKNAVVANSQKYLESHFEFSSDWDNVSKVAYIENSKRDKSVRAILDDSGDVIIPGECIQSPCFYISVVGLRGDVVITSHPASVGVQSSGPLDGIEPETPVEPVFAQVLDGLKDKADKADLDSYKKSNDAEVAKKLAGLDVDDEFTSYNKYVEDCKKEAREALR